MSRMNYNRPRGGYELEPWRKSVPVVAQPKARPALVRTHEAQGHRVFVTRCKPGSVHAGAYRCAECGIHLAWTSK